MVKRLLHRRSKRDPKPPETAGGAGKKKESLWKTEVKDHLLQQHVHLSDSPSRAGGGAAAGASPGKCPIANCKIPVLRSGGDAESHRAQYHLPCRYAPRCKFMGDWIEFADHMVHCPFKEVACAFGCRDLVPRSAYDDHVRVFHAQCANAGRGCAFRGEHYRVLAHEDRCDFQLVACSQAGCAARVRRSGMENHKVLCHIPCRQAPLCSFNGHWVALADHAAKCEFRAVACEFGCPHKVPRNKMAEHVRQSHALCRFHAHGCSFRGQAFEMSGHESSCAFDTVECPEAGCGHRCQKYLLEKHRKNVHLPCKYAPQCKFTGDMVAVADHVQQCRYKLSTGKSSSTSVDSVSLLLSKSSLSGGGCDQHSSSSEDLLPAAEKPAKKSSHAHRRRREKAALKSTKKAEDRGPSCWE